MERVLRVLSVWAILVVVLPAPGRTAEGAGAERLGDVLLVATGAGAYLTTFAQRDPLGRPQFYRGFLTNLGATFALKLAVDKERPDGSGSDSFPSAHASIAFQSASFLQLRYGWTCGAPAYAAATVVGWSRVAADRHDPVDVLAGAAIGAGSSWLFTSRFDRLAVQPIARGGVYGVRVAGEW